MNIAIAGPNIARAVMPTTIRDNRELGCPLHDFAIRRAHVNDEMLASARYSVDSVFVKDYLAKRASE